jgi:hypothetical protein
MKPELREDIEIHKTNAGFEVRVVALEFELLRGRCCSDFCQYVLESRRLTFRPFALVLIASSLDLLRRRSIFQVWPAFVKA